MPFGLRRSTPHQWLTSDMMSATIAELILSSGHCPTSMIYLGTLIRGASRSFLISFPITPQINTPGSRKADHRGLIQKEIGISGATASQMACRQTIGYPNLVVRLGHSMRVRNNTIYTVFCASSQT